MALGRNLSCLCGQGVLGIGGVWAFRVPGFTVILETDQIPPPLYNLIDNIPFCGSKTRGVWKVVSPAPLAGLAGRGLTDLLPRPGSGLQMQDPDSRPSLSVTERLPALRPNTPLTIWNQAPAPLLALRSVITEPLPRPLR